MTNQPNSPEARDIAHLIHPYTNLELHKTAGPLIMDKAEGVWITDIHGKRYLEGLAGLWCTGLGYGNDRLVRAATRQMKSLSFTHVFAHKSHMPGIDLAERLCKITPIAGDGRKMAKVVFANSGSEANDTAAKLVWYYHNAIGQPQKKKIISRQKGYHGVTALAASMTGLPILHKDFDLPLPGILHTSCPHYYRFGKENETETEFADRLIREVEDLIEREGADTIGAFIAEPVMGAGGVIVPPKTYFEKLQPVLRQHNILLIADEVICGFGRTGEMFGSDYFNINPDIMVMAKQLTSAYFPLSATVISHTIAEQLVENSARHGSFGMGYTYSAHPVGAAVANEVLNIYEDTKLLSHVKKISLKFQEGLRHFADHPLVGEARGVGLIGACELVKNKNTKENFDPEQKVAIKMAKFCEDLGLIVRALGGDGVALCPPLIITEEEIDIMLERYGNALEMTWNWLQDQ